MAEKGNPASISDVGVGLLATRACIEGAAMNVRINLAGLKDENVKAVLREQIQTDHRGIRSAIPGSIDQIVESKLVEGDS